MLEVNGVTHTDTQHGAWIAATALSLFAIVVRLFGQRELMSMDLFWLQETEILLPITVV